MYYKKLPHYRQMSKCVKSRLTENDNKTKINSMKYRALKMKIQLHRKIQHISINKRKNCLIVFLH